MSRVTYTDTPDTLDQESLRTAHAVRLVTAAEEGTGVNALPEGVYGFTYAPALPNAPLFALRRYRSFETHKVAGGEVYIVGFVDPETARSVAATLTDLQITLQAEPNATATILTTIPYSRIGQHRQYAAPNQDGFAVTIKPA